MLYIIIDHDDVYNYYFDFLNWLEKNPLRGAFYLIGVYTLAVSVFFPGFLIGGGAGFAFTQAFDNAFYGWIVGVLISWMGSTLSALLAHIISKWFCQE
jgi:uncharacterized membrane protein YdjX (TVP38/TMEM64 family)